MVESHSCCYIFFHYTMFKEWGAAGTAQHRRLCLRVQVSVFVRPTTRSGFWWQISEQRVIYLFPDQSSCLSSGHWQRSHPVWPRRPSGAISVYCTTSNVRCLLELYVRSSLPCSTCVNIYSAASAADMSLHQSVLLLFLVGKHTSDSDSN